MNPEPHLLRFTFDGRQFETSFIFKVHDGTDVMTNNCITFSELKELESDISANAPEKGCFRPMLSRANLPADVTPTDVLQTLSTKLKFAILPKKRLFTISDAARLPNPKTGIPFRLTGISNGHLSHKIQ